MNGGCNMREPFEAIIDTDDGLQHLDLSCPRWQFDAAVAHLRGDADSLRIAGYGGFDEVVLPRVNGNLPSLEVMRDLAETALLVRGREDVFLITLHKAITEDDAPFNAETFARVMDMTQQRFVGWHRDWEDFLATHLRNSLAGMEEYQASAIIRCIDLADYARVLDARTVYSAISPRFGDFMCFFRVD